MAQNDRTDTSGNGSEVRPRGSLGSCICVQQPGRVTKRADGGFDWDIDPTCPYHLLAAKHPDDHSIPWNCPTYWDGCNCAEPHPLNRLESDDD